MTEATRTKLEAAARYASALSGDAPIVGNDKDQIVFVGSGSVKLVAHASAGREQVVAFQFAGDLVSVPATRAHAYSLSALDDCELISFPADEFFKLVQQEEGIILEVLKCSLVALANCREKAITLGRKTAQERLASFLVSMAERGGTPVDRGVELHLPMSRSDMGDSLGLTIETVSRQLSELRASGLLITPSRSKFLLLDLAGLQARAGHIRAAA
ncbi:Crp/Fnr family transcriptional regulator [Erythrobacter crassostreae]|uniref:Crp/Fnr family transcriptional regulator n=1 Tax=Erythrobacter crassostreae TaxID=2828328 RepID=A0A9X1F4A7_9SPHN|nr:Crp/Fnr family transcriptional regulator [Erythrobacter crassostrea]MBV7259068.1 Crp/Fnr family transcriptional regulator [Erythrobacter crassostrea]